MMYAGMRTTVRLTTTRRAKRVRFMGVYDSHGYVAAMQGWV
jgi:hypothetical protein